MVVSVIWLEVLPRHDYPNPNVAVESPHGTITCVIIDAGHGGQDSGAVHAGVQEKDLTLDVALRLERLLRGKGLKTILTRTADGAVSLANRAAIANRENNCVFVSIHFDEGGRSAASGVQTFYAVRQVANGGFLASWLPFLQRTASAPATAESQSLAGFVQQSLVARTQASNRGTRAEQFYVVANVRHPAVLVEGGFLTNSADIAKLTTDAYRQQLANAISEGILQYREIARAQQTAAVAGEPRA